MMRRLCTVVAMAGAVVGAVPAVAAVAAPAHGHGVHRNLPGDGPRALYRHEPQLPKAAGWPGPDDAFSRTSGTGRLADGGLFWTDYLYDDHGTTTASTGGLSVTAGSPSFGTYTYPDGPASGNGADIFRAAVLRRAHASYWRVDWNTLLSARVPIAEWTFDRDDNAATGGSAWPAGAGAHSPGIDTALVMSSRGAQVIGVTTGKVRKTLPVTVDRAAHSFVVRVPDAVLRPHGTWRIRLAAGLADGAGTGFAPAADAVPGQTAIYNVTFRTPAQEKPADNFWDDEAQTSALASGNVTPFSKRLQWSALANRRRTPQPLVRGWSDRWYVSDVALGSGIITSAESIADGDPNYLGRVQPYAVYVPKSYSQKRPAPLTFLLHSLTQNHNQYAATTPHFTALACEDRHSICATTLGRGPDGNYFDTAELDFWQVWHSLAATYRLDPNRTVLCGYSMGGIGTNQLTMAHPDLFARGVTLAGAVGDVASLRNLRWVPMYLAGGAEDELVPITVERAEATALQSLGDRFRWLLYPVIDHVAYELADSFADAARFMGHARRAVDPGRFDFTWMPHNGAQGFSARAATGGGISWTQLPKLGVGTTGDYWLRHLVARDRKASSARLRAFSGERPVRAVRTHVSSHVEVTSGPEPGYATTLRWTRGGPSHRSPVIRLHLANVRALQVLLGAAGFRPGMSGRLRVVTDGPTTLHLGTHTVHVGKGSHVVRFVA
jgi:poly(3-hydroxybutyrate) depolymerase